MRIVTRYTHASGVISTHHELVVCRSNDMQEFVDAAATADVLVHISMDGYRATKHLHKPRIFMIVTDDPNAYTWRSMDEVFLDHTVLGITAHSEQVLWNWRVPVHKAWMIPKGVAFNRTHKWNPVKNELVFFGNAFPRRAWHVGAAALDWMASRFPITMYGFENEEMEYPHKLPWLEYTGISEVASQYAGTFLPYKYSASPCWMCEAMLQELPIVSTDFDYARVHIPHLVCPTLDEAARRVEAVLTNPHDHYDPTIRDHALLAFSTERAATAFDGMLRTLL